MIEKDEFGFIKRTARFLLAILLQGMLAAVWLHHICTRIRTG